ncbi:MAG: hypothetical protein HN348_08180, partial [Proteobacteria bacterium]|nr:hypothetical protein [Pseudomonadota bacterium]
TEEQGFRDGRLNYWYAPRGFAVFRTPLDDSLSTVTAELAGTDAGTIYFLDESGESLWGGGPSVSTWSGGRLEVELSPWSYPQLASYDRYAWFLAGNYHGSPELTVSVDCDRSGQPARPGLPILQTPGETVRTIETVGGTGPRTFSASGLPNGVRLSSDGILTAQSPEPGKSDVKIKIFDALGASSSTTMPLYVGGEAACEDYERLKCGEQASGTFTLSIWDDPSHGESTRTFCLLDDATEATYVTVVSEAIESTNIGIAAVYPGRRPDDFLDDGEGRYILYVDPGDTSGAVLADDSSPPLGGYDEFPLFLVVNSFTPGDWTLELDCLD